MIKKNALTTGVRSSPQSGRRRWHWRVVIQGGGAAGWSVVEVCPQISRKDQATKESLFVTAQKAKVVPLPVETTLVAYVSQIARMKRDTKILAVVFD